MSASKILDSDTLENNTETTLKILQKQILYKILA